MLKEKWQVSVASGEGAAQVGEAPEPQGTQPALIPSPSLTLQTRLSHEKSATWCTGTSSKFSHPENNSEKTSNHILDLVTTSLIWCSLPRTGGEVPS